MKKFSVFIVLVFGLGLLLGGAPLLCAQGSDVDEFTLEEITVTAQKREENQQKVPIAMEVISADEIKELGKNDIDEILYGISNTIVEKAQDGYRVTIRGITDNSEPWKGQALGPPAVAINIDGVYSNRKDTGSGLFDLERVEVLYGPQSTMYMSNSPGGIINVVSANPKVDQYEVSASLEAGSYSLIHTEGAMNAPLGDKTAIRASFSTSVRDGYHSNGNDDEDTKSARMKALYQPNDNLSFIVTGEVTRSGGAGFGSGVVIFDTEDGYWYETAPQLMNTYVRTGPVTDPWTGTDFEKFSDVYNIGKKTYGQVNWNTRAGEISITPSYGNRKGSSTIAFMDPGSGQVSDSYLNTSAREKGLEISMNSAPDFFFQWNAGLFYYQSFDRNTDTSQDYLDSDPVTVLVYDNPQRPGSPQGIVSDDGNTTFPHWGRYSNRRLTNTKKAFFINATYPITDVFRVTAGYRQSWDTMKTDNEEIRGGPGLAPGELRYDWEKFLMENDGEPDYNVGFEYDMGENSMLYANYKTSYRVQGMGGGPGGGANQDPETLKAYTLGAKNRFFGNKLQINAAGYYYDYRNYRAMGNDMEIWTDDWNNNGVPDPGREAGEVNRMRYVGQRSGDGRMMGLDLSTSWIITDKDRLNMTVSYIDSEWTDLVLNIDEDYQTWMELVDGQIVYVTMQSESFNGYPMMSTPPWNVNLTYDHTFHLWNGGTLKAALAVKYKTAFDLSWRRIDYPINHQEAFHMEDVNLVYNDPGGKWNISAYVKNVFNYAEKRNIINMAGRKLLSIGNPRTYGAVLSIKY
jgi:iron complex outermembrane receptor protein